MVRVRTSPQSLQMPPSSICSCRQPLAISAPSCREPDGPSANKRAKFQVGPAEGRPSYVFRSYWIPGSYAPALSEKRHSLLRLLKNKGFTEESMAKVGLYAISKSTTLESNKSHAPYLGEDRAILPVGAPSVDPLVVNTHQAFNR